MAFDFSGTSDNPLSSLRGHDPSWSCDVHHELIKLYCNTHKAALCYACAFTDHQKPCDVKDLERTVKDLRGKLNGTCQEIKQNKRQLAELNSHIKSCAEFINDHMDSVKREVMIVCETKLRSVVEKMREEAKLINQEAEREIEAINERRRERLRMCQEEAEHTENWITVSQQDMLSDIADIKKKVQEKISEMEHRHQTTTVNVEDEEGKIAKLSQDDKELVIYGYHFLESQQGPIELTREHEAVETIKREVAAVKYLAGKDDSECCGRIDGFVGKWEIVDTIDIPAHVEDSTIVELIGETDVAISEHQGDLHVVNLRTRSTKRVVAGDVHTSVKSCAHTSDMIVCGRGEANCKADQLKKSIDVYDRKWKFIKNITIPRMPPSEKVATCVILDVNQDGMILASEFGEPHVHVINPADNEILKTVTIKAVDNRIVLLSSGDLILKTELCKYTVYTRSGVVKNTVTGMKWDSSECSVDTVTDFGYVTYKDYDKGKYRVDQVSWDGIQARSIVEYPFSDRCPVPSPSFVTPSGKLVSSNGDKIFVCKKSFVLSP